LLQWKVISHIYFTFSILMSFHSVNSRSKRTNSKIVNC
jgi:hypothetical protein